MKFNDPSNKEQNWIEALRLWERVRNWRDYEVSDIDQLVNIKNLIISLWNEKDWLKIACGDSRRVEEYVSGCKFWPIVGDVANLLKHGERNPGRQRTDAEILERVIELGVEGKQKRRAYFVRLAAEGTVELQELVRGALDEIENFKDTLIEEAL